MSQATANLRLQVVVEIDASGPWGTTTTLEEAYRNAKREGLHRLQDMLAKGHGKIIGEPTIIACFVPLQEIEERKR